jgi:hypothetical protein
VRRWEAEIFEKEWACLLLLLMLVVVVMVVVVVVWCVGGRGGWWVLPIMLWEQLHVHEVWRTFLVTVKVSPEPSIRARVSSTWGCCCTGSGSACREIIKRKDFYSYVVSWYG